VAEFPLVDLATKSLTQLKKSLVESPTLGCQHGIDLFFEELEREKTACAERTKAERQARSERGRFQLPITRDAFEEYRAEQEEAEEKRKREQVEAEKAEKDMAAENAKRLKTDMEDFRKYCRDGNLDGSRLYES
jgi:hypothetical protein